MNNSITALAVSLMAVAGVVFLFFRGPALVPVSNPVPEAGAISGPESTNPYQCYSGVCHYYYKTAMANASTTCAFKSPNATTTLVQGSAYIKSASGATFTAEWGNSASPNATTTLISRLLSAGATSFVQASTTLPNDALTDLNVIPPATYVNFKVGSSSPTVSGTCSLTLRGI